jgi:hypothetical protein
LESQELEKNPIEAVPRNRLVWFFPGAVGNKKGASLGKE